MFGKQSRKASSPGSALDDKRSQHNNSSNNSSNNKNQDESSSSGACDLQAKYNKSQLDLERSNASLRTVQRNYDSISQKLAGIQRDLKTSQHDATQHADKAKEAMERAEAAEARLAAIEAECKSAMAKSLSDARAKGAALDAQRAYLQETLEENTALVRSVQDLSSKIQSAKAIHESMEVQNQRLKDELDKSLAHSKESDQRLSSTEAALRSLESKSATSDQLVISLRQQVEALQAQQADHDEVRKERDSLQQQLAAAKKSKEGQSSKRVPKPAPSPQGNDGGNSAPNEEIQMLRRERDAAISQQSIAANDCRAAKASMKMLSKENDEMRERIKALEKNKEELKASVEQAVRSAERKKTDVLVCKAKELEVVRDGWRKKHKNALASFIPFLSAVKMGMRRLDAAEHRMEHQLGKPMTATIQKLDKSIARDRETQIGIVEKLTMETERLASGVEALDQLCTSVQQSSAEQVALVKSQLEQSQASVRQVSKELQAVLSKCEQQRMLNAEMSANMNIEADRSIAKIQGYQLMIDTYKKTIEVLEANNAQLQEDVAKFKGISEASVEEIRAQVVEETKASREEEKCKESIKKKAQAALFKGINRELRDYKKSSEELGRELETTKIDLQQMTKEKEMHERTATDLKNRMHMAIEKNKMNSEQSERKTREVAAKFESEIRRLQRAHEIDVARHQSQMEAKELEMRVLTQKLSAKDQEFQEVERTYTRNVTNLQDELEVERLMRKKISEENTEGREAVHRTRETVINIEEDMKEFYTHVCAMDIPGADNDMCFPHLRLRQAKESQQQEEKRIDQERLHLGPLMDESHKPVVLEGEVKEIRGVITAFITCVQEIVYQYALLRKQVGRTPASALLSNIPSLNL